MFDCKFYKYNQISTPTTYNIFYSAANTDLAEKNIDSRKSGAFKGILEYIQNISRIKEQTLIYSKRWDKIPKKNIIEKYHGRLFNV